MEWQPIETAPKDGTRILTVVADKNLQRVCWWQYSSWVYHVKYAGPFTICWPTHWMPLPDPPAQEDRTR